MKNLLILLISISLFGCAGYTPLYGELGEKVSAIGVAKVEINHANGNIGERRIAQLMDQQLSRVFNNNINNTYDLYVTLEPREESIAKRSDDTDQRKSTSISARVSLRKVENGKPVFSVSLSKSSSYTVQGQAFATEAAKIKAQESIISELTGDIIQRTALWARGYADNEDSK